MEKEQVRKGTSNIYILYNAEQFVFVICIFSSSTP